MLLYVLSMQSCIHPYTFMYVRNYVCMNAGMYFVFRACMDSCMHGYFYIAAFIMEKVKVTVPDLMCHENNINMK